MARSLRITRLITPAFRSTLDHFRSRKSVSGRPDLVFRKARVFVFVEGDFWHGYQYPRWRQGLSAYWQAKIERNRCRIAELVTHARTRST